MRVKPVHLTRYFTAPLAGRGPTSAASLAAPAVRSAPSQPGSSRRAKAATAAFSSSNTASSWCSSQVTSSRRHHSYSGSYCGGCRWSLHTGLPQQRRCPSATLTIAAHRAAALVAATVVGSLASKASWSSCRRAARRGHPTLFVAAAAAPKSGPYAAAAAVDDFEAAAGEPYLGPAVDLVSALEALSYTRTFTQMCVFLENNSQLFRGPEVAALVLQAATVSELSAQRQMAAAMAVAERQSAAAGDGEQGPLSPEAMASAVEDLLRAAGPSGAVGTDGGTDDDNVLDELDAADQLLEWATPVLRAHIKRYPPEATLALLSALAQLQQYDTRLMELAAEAFKSDPRVWLRRAAPPPTSSPFATGGNASAAGGDNEFAYGGYGEEGGEEGAAADPWFTLVSLVNAFARLGHYDRALMSAIAQQAVALMPEVWDRAEAEDAAAAEAAGGERAAAAAAGSNVTGTVVGLVSAFLELSHLDPRLMQAVGEHLAAFSHQLDRDTLSEALLAFAAFNARNPPFYSLLLRQLVDMPPQQDQSGAGAGASITPRGAGALYRACVLISAMGDVPELATPAAAAAAAALDPEAAEALRVGAGLSALLRECLAAFPLSSLHAAPLGRPTPEQLDAAAAGQTPELLEAWGATGLLTVPQILSTLQQLPVEPLPPAALTAASWAAATAAPSPPPLFDNAAGGDGDDDGLVTGGADAVAWVPPDALLLYDGPDGPESGSGSGVRIAIKALDEGLHSCRNVGLDPDSEPDRPGPRSGLSSSSAAAEAEAASWRRRRQLRLRGPALSELRCLEAWGWRVLVVPVGLWGEMDPGSRRTWMLRRLNELAAEDPDGGGAPMGPEVWV